MNDYQREQLDALTIVRRGLVQMDDRERRRLRATVRDYLAFRRSVDAWLDRHCNGICTQTCYQSRTSACCSRDGIITFFADAVVNALVAAPETLDRMETRLRGVNQGHRCVYLSADGCVWSVRPVVCAMFLCDRAMQAVFTADPPARTEWDHWRKASKTFTWPNRPVLFDHLERRFMQLGYRSTLMHLNLSPGLLHVKRQAGLD